MEECISKTLGIKVKALKAKLCSRNQLTKMFATVYEEDSFCTSNIILFHYQLFHILFACYVTDRKGILLVGVLPCANVFPCGERGLICERSIRQAFSNSQ
jgi:hypothetical protein